MDWVRDSFSWLGTAAFLAVAGYRVARLVAAARSPRTYPGCHRAVDVAHVLMAVGMAEMVSPVGGPLPMAAWLVGWWLWLVAAAVDFCWPVVGAGCPHWPRNACHGSGQAVAA